MFYKEYLPPAGLNKYIKCFWVLEHDYTEKLHTYEHLWAGVHTELIFSFGMPYYKKDDHKQDKLPGNFVIFPFKQQLLLYSDGFTGLAAVRFQPWAIHKFINEPIGSLMGKIIGANELLGKDAMLLNRQLNGQSREGKVHTLANYLTARVQAFQDKEIASQPIAQEITALKGMVNVKELAEKFNKNQRRIERFFISEIGISAKLFARIIRFNNARELLAQNPKAQLAGVAYQMGYADQAHFSKNFKELFGITPAEFKRRVLSFYEATA